MADNEWERPKSPPPPLFLGRKERNLVKQVNDELIEKAFVFLRYFLDLCKFLRCMY